MQTIKYRKIVTGDPSGDPRSYLHQTTGPCGPGHAMQIYHTTCHQLGEFYDIVSLIVNLSWSLLYIHSADQMLAQQAISNIHLQKIKKRKEKTSY